MRVLILINNKIDYVEVEADPVVGAPRSFYRLFKPSNDYYTDFCIQRFFINHEEYAAFYYIYTEKQFEWTDIIGKAIAFYAFAYDIIPIHVKAHTDEQIHTHKLWKARQ